MKATHIAFLGILPATLLTTACGDDVTKVTKIEETSGMEVAASADSLGKCTAEIAGAMKFASKENAVYVCADSAWKNVSEKEKISCSTETLPDSSGFKIVCDGDSIGIVKNGENGKNGEKGSVGEGCELSDNGDGTIAVVCGNASTTLYKAICDGKPYDPDSNLCAGGLIAPLSKKNVWDLMNPEIEYGVFVDARDGQVYRSVEIGGTTWMAENLNFDIKDSSSTIDSASYCYNNVPDSCQKYGRLYKWFFAMSACPEGWHLPDTTEFQELIAAVGGADAAAKALKSTSGWTDDKGNDISGSDDYGFSALPAGMHYYRGDFYRLGNATDFWSSIKNTDVSPAKLYFLHLYSSNPISVSNATYTTDAHPVRCVRD